MGNVAWRWGWRLLKIVVVVSVIAAVVYRLRFAPVPVTARQVERGAIVADVMGTGTLEARVTVTISPKISGRIEEVLVDQGDRVEAGTLLVRLDDTELAQQVAIAEAEVEAARAAIARLETDKMRAVAVFAAAKISHARNQALVVKNAASQDDVDKAVEALAVAQAGVSRSEAAITEGQKQLVAAGRTLEYHRARLMDTEVAAPFAGLIVRRHREPGDIVVPGGAILTLISTDELWISAWVDETEMAHLQEEQPARVAFRSEHDVSYPGKVARMGKEADRETREFIVDVRVLELPHNWAVGQRAEVYIETDRKSDVTFLPATYIVMRDGEKGVFVDDQGHAAWRPITVGLRSRDMVEVVEGVQPGDTVVIPVDPKKSLTEGRRVAAS